MQAVNKFVSRYKRRGVDEEGKVANYVETEQIILYHTYALSFVQVYTRLSLAAHIIILTSDWSRSAALSLFSGRSRGTSTGLRPGSTGKYWPLISAHIVILTSD